MKFIIIGSMVQFLAYQFLTFIQLSTDAITEAEHTLMDYGIAGVFILFLIISLIVLWKDNKKKDKAINDLHESNRKLHESYQTKIIDIADNFGEVMKKSQKIIMQFAHNEEKQTTVMEKIEDVLQILSRR